MLKSEPNYAAVQASLGSACARPQHGEPQMRDAIPLDALRRIAQGDIVDRQLAEEWTALAHDHRHEVHRDRVQQTQLKALSGNGASRHRHAPIPRYLLRF